jgi:beta-N-acetylhexosaminidase
MKQFLAIIFLLMIRAVPGLCCNFPHRGSPDLDSIWADSVCRTLTPAERAGQLLMIRAVSNKDSVYDDSLVNIIRTWNIGGVCFFKGTPYHQAELTNRIQKAAQVPLLITTDAENGLGMRIDSTISFPKQMTLGAITDDSLVYKTSRAIGKDCRRIGITMNFAPVADVNNNPLNPVIGMRSFGEDREEVAEKCVLFMKGLQDEGIVPVAKHFPGHGNTGSDSHQLLPVIRESKEQLDSTELFPFKKLIHEGIPVVMAGHIHVPVYDSSKNAASSLSSVIIDTLLRKKLGFRGWVITDALDMKGVTKYFSPGEIAVKALEAGNDILLLPPDAPAAINAILAACDSSEILREKMEQKCRHVLLLKHLSGLTVPQTVELAHLTSDLNSSASQVLNDKLFRNAITLVKNDQNLVPLVITGIKKIAALSIGDTNITVFQKGLARYAPVRFMNLPSRFSPEQMDSLIRILRDYQVIIVGIHCRKSIPAENWGISRQTATLLDSLGTFSTVIADVFGSPYGLSVLNQLTRVSTIFVSYQNTPEAEDASAQMIFGGIQTSGRLPVSGSADFPLHTSIKTAKTRLEFCRPEEACISQEKLRIIDSLALSGIRQKAYPGCQVLFAKDGKVFYEKSFGNPQYGDTIVVSNEDIFDLASLTKTLATTLAIMKLYEEGKIRLDQTLGAFLTEVKGSNKEKLTIRDIMTHQAGLESWIRFYDKTLSSGKQDPSIYRQEPSPEFPVRVADHLYITKGYQDTIYKEIIRSPLRTSNGYLYSDLGFYLLRRVIEVVSGMNFQDYLENEFYLPLGLTTLGFNPLEHFRSGRIMPTENDTVFRMQQIRGYVHDPGAAMLGGVSGHAGLFSDAGDIAIILQMLLNGGTYGGKQYLLPSTVKEFTRTQFPGTANRRALGFDKPLRNHPQDGPSCPGASSLSFGHSGFTGTYFWVDPADNLIYVFLSNRVFPDASNQRLSSMNLRTRIHQAMYDILDKDEN